MSPLHRKSIQKFLTLLANEEFFEAHEQMEEQWIASGRQRGDLWHGLTQLAVALTHQQRGNLRGAGRLHSRALGKLGPLLDRDYVPGQKLREILAPALTLAAQRFQNSNTD